MNLYLEQAAEEIEQAISDADQLQALTKATLQKFTNYLKRKQQEKIERRYHLNNLTDDSNSVKQFDKSSFNQLKILEFFNKMHRDMDKQFRELKEMIPSNPQTYVIEEINEQEGISKVLEQKVAQKPTQEPKYFPLFKQQQNGGVQKQVVIGQNQTTLQMFQQNTPLNQSQQGQQQNLTQTQQSNINQMKENINQKQIKPEQPTETIKPVLKPKDVKEASISYGRLTKFQYQKLKYTTKNEGNCVFCSLEANYENLGPLLLIPSNQDPEKKYQLHEMCSLWSQNLVFFSDAGQCDPTNIDQEIEKSKTTKCFLCGRIGATICCAVCPQAFHFTCLMKSASTGKLIENQFKFFCDKHKRKAQKEDSSCDEVGGQKKKKKPKIKLNQSKAQIKTSPRRSPKKSPKRGKSPATKQLHYNRVIISNDDGELSYSYLPQWLQKTPKLYDLTQQQQFLEQQQSQQQQQQYTQPECKLEQQ